MKKYIYGAGGHGKVVLDAMRTIGLVCDGFVDDKETGLLAGLSVHAQSELDLDSIALHLAIGNAKAREVIVSRLNKAQFFSVIHEAAIVAKDARVDDGSFVAAGAIIAPAAVIGKHCIVNHAAIVDHDCIVGNYTHIAPQSNLGGAVEVGKGVLIGASAVILPGVKVGDYAVIGAGAVVTRDIGAGSAVVGNPARLMN